MNQDRTNRLRLKTDDDDYENRRTNECKQQTIMMNKTVTSA